MAMKRIPRSESVIIVLTQVDAKNMEIGQLQADLQATQARLQENEQARDNTKRCLLSLLKKRIIKNEVFARGKG